jgi:CheY-like chemotaxis protein
VCDVFTRALRQAGFIADSVLSGQAGIALARRRGFDLALVDLRLPDIQGTDVIRALRGGSGRVQCILVSGFLTVEVTVEAMKLGAFDVIPKPARLDRLLSVVRAALEVTAPPGRRRTGSAAGLTPRPLSRPLATMRPKSAAERWAFQIIKACQSEGDLKTLDDWATFNGVSYSTLCEICRLVNIRPHDARDLARVLSAVMKARRLDCPIDVLLDVSDRRTLRVLLDKAGIGLGSPKGSVSVERLFEGQRFVQPDNEGLRVLRGILAGPRNTAPQPDLAG